MEFSLIHSANSAASTNGDNDDTINSNFLMYYWLMMTVAMVMVVMGACNRAAMRKKFDIPHRVRSCGQWGDFCLWFWCSGPALCQETRTIIHNNVEDGIWKGPDVMVLEPVDGTAASAEGAPVPPYAPLKREDMVREPMRGASVTPEKVPLLPYVPQLATERSSPSPVDIVSGNA